MLEKAKKRLNQFHKDERGAMSVEMILILAVIGVPVLVLLYIFAKKVVEWFRASDSALDQQNTNPILGP